MSDENEIGEEKLRELNAEADQLKEELNAKYKAFMEKNTGRTQDMHEMHIRFIVDLAAGGDEEAMSVIIRAIKESEDFTGGEVPFDAN